MATPTPPGKGGQRPAIRITAALIPDQPTGSTSRFSVETPTELWSSNSSSMTDVATTQNNQDSGSATFSLVAGADWCRGSRQVCVRPACEGFLGCGAGVYPSKMLFLSQLA